MHSYSKKKLKDRHHGIDWKINMPLILSFLVPPFKWFWICLAFNRSIWAMGILLSAGVHLASVQAYV